MRRLLWSCAAVVVCVVLSGQRVVAAQGAAACDSPCKVMHLPLIGPPGAVCDSPCKMLNLPLIHQQAQAIPNSNPLRELQGKVKGANGAYAQFEVDKPVVQIPGTMGPQYPDSLKADKIDGEVIAAFEVDTLGLADLSSLRILKSTHPLFSAAVRNALPWMRFEPAEKGGIKVRQLVRQPFEFHIAH